MIVRMLSQRQELADDKGLMTSAWFRAFSSLFDSVNSRQTVSSGVRSVSSLSTETTALTQKVTVGNSGSFLLTLNFSTTNNANVKTAKVAVNGTVIQTISLNPSTSTQTAVVSMVGRGLASQYSATAGTNCSATGAATAIDTSQQCTITVTLTASVPTDSIYLESWFLDVIG